MATSKSLTRLEIGRKSQLRHFRQEQFSEEWEHWIIPGVSPRAAVDAVLSDPEHVPGSSVVKVAGRYTWKSNMWQLALTMACIITKCQVNDPVLTPTRWVAPGMSADREAYTFGGAVLESDYSMVDEDLRILVAWCMMAHVDDRPEMSQIEGLISGKLAQPWNGAADSDQAITAWSKKVFGEPKDPDAPNEAVLAAVSVSPFPPLVRRGTLTKATVLGPNAHRAREG